MATITKYVVIFNGSPGSGKDTICDYIASKYDADHLSFKKQLYIDTAQYFDLPLERVIDLCTNRATKDTDSPDFNYMTPRQGLIFVSENVIKPIHGKNHYGLVVANNIRTSPKKFIILSDGGFVEEFDAIAAQAQRYGHSLICVHLHRDGCSFGHDSRNYVYHHAFKNISLYNNSSVQDLFDQIDALIECEQLQR